MPRPRTPIASHGAVTVVEVEPGRWRARTRYRFEDGRLRQVERFAPSKAKAVASLKRALTTLSTSTGGDVRRETHLSELADRFLESKADRAPRTLDTYRQTIEHLVRPALGSVTIAEATPERLERFIARVRSTNGPGAAKGCRAVLSGMMGIAARANAVRHNPVRELSPIARARGGAEAIPVERLAELLEAVRADERLRQVDAADMIEFLAGTGCRVGEACAIVWDDVDLEAGRVTIRANVVRARGVGLIRQDHTKTKAGARTIALPSSLLGMLVDRRVRLESNPLGLVFPTVLGNLRDPRNTSRDWAEARERIGYPTVTTHSFRKTVATALDRAGLSARDIAEYLGHENPSITQDVYMAKNAESARAAAAMGDYLAR
ncbi:site-specific integrase [Agromyces humatus]|uniref:Site-specific integrase n=1 Tax=Agromyces humatus TaxID=279573 RepID=A0ABN2L1P4_9MICO|nr:site-specific integrase [Agromyces humatus]